MFYTPHMHSLALAFRELRCINIIPKWGQDQSHPPSPTKVLRLPVGVAPFPVHSSESPLKSLNIPGKTMPRIPSVKIFSSESRTCSVFKSSRYSGEDAPSRFLRCEVYGFSMTVALFYSERRLNINHYAYKTMFRRMLFSVQLSVLLASSLSIDLGNFYQASRALDSLSLCIKHSRSSGSAPCMLTVNPKY